MAKGKESQSRRAQSKLRSKFNSVSDLHQFKLWLEHIKQERILVQAKLILMENL